MWVIHYIINRQWRLGPLNFSLEMRSSENITGRFGGGWNWNIGLMAGGGTLVVNLLVASLRIYISGD